VPYQTSDYDDAGMEVVIPERRDLSPADHDGGTFPKHWV